MNIPVTKPFLPDLREYSALLEGVWNREWLTNNGPLLNELELRLKEWLDVPHFLFVSNGTIALQIAIKAFGLTGEVITTPFSFIATTSSIAWEGCSPVMVDICPRSLNIDPRKIEAAITDKTTAILATHVFGNPCDVIAIDEIATKYGLKVIYDAAHSFGVTFRGRSVFTFGDVSTVSFHATKLYHTCEGGGIFTNCSEMLKVMSQLRNFGYVSPVEFGPVGINGKNSELHAAMGLVNLAHIDEIIEKRKLITQWYDSMLASIGVVYQEWLPGSNKNYAYYPVIFDTEQTLLDVLTVLQNHNVFPRRYFYPSLSSLEYVARRETPVSDDISTRILCLPLYHTLSKEEVDMVSRLIVRTVKYREE